MPVIPANDENLYAYNRSLKYPNPFFDISNSFIPKNIKTLFKFCRDYYHTSGWLRNVISKMATYPITDILFSSQVDRNIRDRLSKILNDELRIKSFLIEIGLDYYVFGNVFISTYLQTNRFLQCSQCQEENIYDNVKNIKMRQFEFYGDCPKCKTKHVKMTAKDNEIATISNFKLVRWAPENVDIDYNPITGNAIYYYTIPTKIKSQITAGNVKLLKEVPLVFLQALKNKQRIELEPSNLYHMKFPTLAEEDMGFGKPMILPALKDIYYLHTLRKANEAISNEHIVPKKVVSPANTATMDPFSMMTLGKWRVELEQNLKKWKLDPNYVAISPIPMQYQELGGNAKMLMVTPEMKFIEENIINSLGVPLEFIKGGTSWTGSSVSLRIVENGFLNYREFLLDFLNYFLIPKITSLLGYEPVKVHFKKFKMSDDSESKQLAINLNAAGKISDNTLLNDFGFDALEEAEVTRKNKFQALDDLVKEQEKQAEAQGRAQLILSKYQAEAQLMMTKIPLKHKIALFQTELSQENGQTKESLEVLIEKYAIGLFNLPADIQQQSLLNMQAQMPYTFTIVLEYMNMLAAQGSVSANTIPSGNMEAPNEKGVGNREQDKVEVTKDDAQKQHGPTRGEA